MTKKKVFSQFAILLGILVLFNLISTKAYLRLDLTQEGRYTLEKSTRQVLADLDQVITIKAYFSEEVPPNLLQAKRDFQEQLQEYERRAGGNLVYTFINPNENEETEREAQQDGISPFLVNIRERDQVKQIRAYMGAVFHTGKDKEVIPYIAPGASLEYTLTSTLKKLTIKEKPVLAFAQGHGEPSLGGVSQLVEELSILYDVRAIDLSDTTLETIPASYKALAWIRPTDTIPPMAFDKVRAYLQQGGHLFVAQSGIKANLTSQYPSIEPGPYTGLKDWLRTLNIHFANTCLVDNNCNNVNVQQRQGSFILTSQARFPYHPIIQDFAEHPASKGLEALFMPMSSAVYFQAQDSTTQAMPLLKSSALSGMREVPLPIAIDYRWQDSDFEAGPQTLAIAIEGTWAGPTPSRAVAIANDAFIINGETDPEQPNQQPQQLSPGNVQFAANAIDWLADDTGLIDLRTKIITTRPLDEIDDAKKTFIQYGNVFLPILLVLFYAFVRRHLQLRQRYLWGQEHF